MKKPTAQVAIQTSEGQDRENQLSDAELEQVTGGGLLSSPMGAKARPPIVSWSGAPYVPVEDVEAY
jgi:hypothetical protein